MIKTKSIPDGYVFCFWNRIKDYPDKNKVAKAAEEDGVLELSSDIDSWDYWIESFDGERAKEDVDNVLSGNYSKICINIRTDSWPPRKIYKGERFVSRVLDRSVEYKFRKKRIITFFI